METQAVLMELETLLIFHGWIELSALDRVQNVFTIFKRKYPHALWITIETLLGHVLGRL